MNFAVPVGLNWKVHSFTSAVIVAGAVAIAFSNAGLAKWVKPLNKETGVFGMYRMMKLNVHSSAVMRAGLVCEQKKNQIWANCKGVGSGVGFSQNYTQSTAAVPSPYADLLIQVTDTTQGSLKTVVITVWKDLSVISTKDASEPGALVTMVVQNGE